MLGPPITLINQESPTDMPTGQSNRGNSSTEVLPSQVTVACVKLTKEIGTGREHTSRESIMVGGPLEPLECLLSDLGTGTRALCFSSSIVPVLGDLFLLEGRLYCLHQRHSK